MQTVIITGKEAGDLGDATVAVDRDGHARRAYLVQGGSMTIVIVRPDGFIGAIVNEVNGIDRYFSKIFQVSISRDISVM